MIFISLILSFIYLPLPFIRYLQVSHICELLLADIERSGAITAQTRALQNRLSEDYGFEIEVTHSDDFIWYGGEWRVQLRQFFTIEVSNILPVYIFSPDWGEKYSLHLRIAKRLTGMGRVYWREGEINLTTAALAI